MGSGFSLPNLNIKSRFSKSCHSQCCNEETHSISFCVCSHCGSHIKLSNLPYSDYDRNEYTRKGQAKIN